VLYRVIIAPSAQRSIDRLPPVDARRIYAATEALGHNPRPPGCVKLTQSPLWRIRVGQYRIVYAIDDAALLVTVVKAGHRRDVYR
jgi:mRNA interferase RelE/StbE